MGQSFKPDNLMKRWQALSGRTRAWLLIGSGLIVLCLCCANVARIGAQSSTMSTTNTNAVVASHQPTQKAATSIPTRTNTPTRTPPTSIPTKTPPTPTPPTSHYPPTTKADLLGLAAHGDASAIHEIHSESVGLVGVCPEPKREVIVDPSVTGQQLAEDLLAYFYSQQLDSPCGSLVLAYHNQSEADDAYTAGRVNFDVIDASGQANIDPNGTNLKYTLTLDIGDVASGQGYTVMY